jgi:hypothetical protein
MKRLTRLMAVLLAVPVLLSAAMTATAGTASAAVARPAGYSTGIIFGGCSPLQDGRFTVIKWGGNLYWAECIHLPFGWYWVESERGCPDAARAPARIAGGPARVIC